MTATSSQPQEPPPTLEQRIKISLRELEVHLPEVDAFVDGADPGVIEIFKLASQIRQHSEALVRDLDALHDKRYPESVDRRENIK